MGKTVERRRFFALAAGVTALLGLSAACQSSPSPTPAPAPPTSAPTTPPKPAATATKPTASAATKPAATAKPATAAPAKAPEMTDFTLALNAKNFTSTPLWAADDAGAFKNRGIKLATPEFAGGNLIVRTMLSNAADTAVVSVQPIYASIAQGADLMMVAAPALKTSFAIVGKKEYDSLESLYGKTIGANGPGAGLENFVIALYQAKNLDATKLNFVNIGATAAQWGALSADKVDAAVVISSEFGLLKTRPQLHVIAKGWEILTFFNRFGSPVHQKDMQERNDLFERFFVALSEAYRWGLDHKTEVVQTAIERLDFKQEVAEAAFDDLIENELLNPDLAFTQKHVEYMQQLNVDSNQQPKVLPFDQVADLRYVKHVADTLGEYKPKS